MFEPGRGKGERGREEEGLVASWSAVAMKKESE